MIWAPVLLFVAAARWLVGCLVGEILVGWCVFSGLADPLRPPQIHIPAWEPRKRRDRLNWQWRVCVAQRDALQPETTRLLFKLWRWRGALWLTSWLFPARNSFFGSYFLLLFFFLISFFGSILFFLHSVLPTFLVSFASFLFSSFIPSVLSRFPSPSFLPSLLSVLSFLLCSPLSFLHHFFFPSFL